MGAHGGACGACGCEVPAGPPVMSYAGSGCGDYIQETTYKYVGFGAGEFAVVAKKSNSACLFISGGVGLLVLVIVVVLLLISGPVTTTTTPAGPPSTCDIWGDPHINTFDKGHADFYGEGIKWIVKTSDVQIQGRYKATPFTNGLAATNAVAIGVQGHTLKVGCME